MNIFRALSLAAALLAASPAFAASGTIFYNSGGATTNSGTTDTATASLVTCDGGTAWDITKGCTGAGANWTTGSTTITLETNANLTGIPVDGSQAIYLTNATNSNQKIFWITGITGCTNSGSCTVTISVAATCATCTAQTWVIGGRTKMPDTSKEAAVRPGDTISIDDNQSCGAAVCFSARVAGDTTTGTVNVKPTSGAVSLTNTGNNIVFTQSGSPTLWHIYPGITFTSGVTSTAVLVNSVTAWIIEGDTFVGATSATAQNCITVGGTLERIINNKFTNCGNDAINTASAMTYVESNQFTSGVVANDVTNTTNAPSGTFKKNLMIGAGGKCLSFTGTASAAGSALVTIALNTCANAHTGGFVATNNILAVMENNIVYNAQQTSGANVSWGSGTDGILLGGGWHGCNDFYAASGTNLTNVAANATTGQADVTTDPTFTSAGTDWSLQNTSPAYHTACFQNPGAYVTAANLIDMGAIQSGSGGGGGTTYYPGIIQ